MREDSKNDAFWKANVGTYSLVGRLPLTTVVVFLRPAAAAPTAPASRVTLASDMIRVCLGGGWGKEKGL